MQSIDDALVSPPQNLIFVDKIAVFVFAAEKQGDYGYCDLFSLVLLLEVEYLLLEVGSERCQTCSGSHKDNFFPLHSVSKGRFAQLSPYLFGNRQEIFRN